MKDLEPSTHKVLLFHFLGKRLDVVADNVLGADSSVVDRSKGVSDRHFLD